MMRRLAISFVCLLLSFSSAEAAYVHVDYDYKGAMMVEAAYLALAKAEGLNTEDIHDILDHYTSAEVATAGIWTSKFLNRKALKDIGLFSSAENHYYKIIRFTVQKRITPRMLRIGKELLCYPDQFLYWGPYLFKTCEDVMNLCAQFEAIVTNGKLSFSDINFLQLNSDLDEYFNLSKLGNIDWQQTWDRITNFPTPKWEDFREDYKELFGKVSPVNLAIAGEEDVKGRASHIFDKFAEAPESLPDLFNQVQDAFREVTSDAAIRGILEGVIGDLKDSLAVERLFDLGQYNVGAYINDYISQLNGQYYTQPWRICHDVSAGIQQTHEYYKQKYTRSLFLFYWGSVWYDVEELEYDSQYDGPEDAWVEKAKEDGYIKTVATTGVVDKKWMTIEVIPKGERQTYIVETITNSNNGKVVDYEVLFDSRTNSEVVFEKEFNQRIETLMRDQEVPEDQKIQYYIEKGDKNYYEIESSASVRNASNASFTVTCHDEVELSKGGFNFKVNERYNSSKMNEYAYPKGMIPAKEPEDVSLWEEKIADLEGKIDKNNEDIADYQQQIEELQAIADTTTNSTTRKNLLSQISSLRIKISNLNVANNSLQEQLDEVNEVYDNYQIDYAEDLDGPYRIPTLENDLAGDFHLHWDDNGSWSGHTYTRHAHIVGMDDGVKFVAEVSQQRREMRFLGIRYHRAIIGVEYRLVSETETSEIVDVIKLTDDMDDQEKADLINDRRSEIQQEYPSCQVTVMKREKDGIEQDDKEDPPHLLWMSDRVALARFVEYRLRQIDGQLAFIERNLYMRKNVLADFKKAFLQGVPRWRTSTPAGAALNRWINVANGVRPD